MKKMILILMCLPSLAFAALGEDRATFERDGAQLGAKSIDLKSDVLPNGVQTKTMKVKGTSIKEFFDKSGRIFAIKWDGVRQPDLSVLLGSYYVDYAVASSSILHGRRHMHSAVQTSHIKVSRGGQAFHLRGLILLKDKMPSGLAERDLR